jgi:hypothetical protein
MNTHQTVKTEEKLSAISKSNPGLNYSHSLNHILATELEIYQSQHNTINSTLAIRFPCYICVQQKLHAKIKIANLTHKATYTDLNCTCYDFSTMVLRLPRELQSLSWSRQLQTQVSFHIHNSLQLVPFWAT